MYIVTNYSTIMWC